MAVESVDVTPGSGKSIAVDTVSSIEHQLVKMEYGADGVATMVEDIAPLPTKLGTPTTANLSSGQVNANSSGANVILAGTAAQTIRLFKFFIQNTGAGSITVRWRSGTNDFHPDITLASGGSWIMDFDSEPWFITNAAEDLILYTSGTGPVVGRFYYKKS